MWQACFSMNEFPLEMQSYLELINPYFLCGHPGSLRLLQWTRVQTQEFKVASFIFQNIVHTFFFFVKVFWFPLNLQYSSPLFLIGLDFYYKIRRIPSEQMSGKFLLRTVNSEKSQLLWQSCEVGLLHASLGQGLRVTTLLSPSLLGQREQRLPFLPSIPSLALFPGAQYEPWWVATLDNALLKYIISVNDTRKHASLATFFCL